MAAAAGSASPCLVSGPGSTPSRPRVRWHQPHWWSGRVVRQRPAKPAHGFDSRLHLQEGPPARLAQRESASLTRKGHWFSSSIAHHSLCSSEALLKPRCRHVPDRCPTGLRRQTRGQRSETRGVAMTTTKPPPPLLSHQRTSLSSAATADATAGTPPSGSRWLPRRRHARHLGGQPASRRGHQPRHRRPRCSGRRPTPVQYADGSAESAQVHVELGHDDAMTSDEARALAAELIAAADEIDRSAEQHRG